MSPAQIGAVFGSSLTNGRTEVAATQPLPLILDGTQVIINGTPAPLFFASPGQINFEIPRTTTATTFSPASPSATALIEVVRNGELIRAGAFQIAPVVPAIFTLNQSGSGPAAAIDALTGTLEPFNARQANGQPNIIAIFATGFGADVTDVDGDVRASVEVTIDGTPVTVLYAGRAPGFTGLNQLNITFPANITAGTHTLAVSRNGISSNVTTIATR
jgi:adhesin/invasin